MPKTSARRPFRDPFVECWFHLNSTKMNSYAVAMSGISDAAKFQNSNLDWLMEIINETDWNSSPLIHAHVELYLIVALWRCNRNLWPILRPFLVCTPIWDRFGATVSHNWDVLTGLTGTIKYSVKYNHSWLTVDGHSNCHWAYWWPLLKQVRYSNQI